jgi:hypothetical protein
VFNAQNCTCGVLGENYICFMLVENINCYLCVLQKKYIPLMFLQHTDSWLRVNMLKDDTEIDIKGIALMITRTENNFINTYSKYRHFQSRYLVEAINILPS